jgi:hypothetical protein
LTVEDDDASFYFRPLVIVAVVAAYIASEAATAYVDVRVGGSHNRRPPQTTSRRPLIAMPRRAA